MTKTVSDTDGNGCLSPFQEREYMLILWDTSQHFRQKKKKKVKGTQLTSIWVLPSFPWSQSVEPEGKPG